MSETIFEKTELHKKSKKKFLEKIEEECGCSNDIVENNIPCSFFLINEHCINKSEKYFITCKEKIKDYVEKEKMEVAVISYGGSASNVLADLMEEEMNLFTRTPIWRKIICHCPEIIDFSIPVVYIYHDPISAYLSMKKRGKGWWDVNQKKLSNDPNLKELSNENLFSLMMEHFYKWSKQTTNKILFVKKEDLFNKKIVETLKEFLQINEIKGLPLERKITSSSVKDIEKEDMEIFLKYWKDIEYINNFGN